MCGVVYFSSTDVQLLRRAPSVAYIRFWSILRYAFVVLLHVFKFALILYIYIECDGSDLLCGCIADFPFEGDYNNYWGNLKILDTTYGKFAHDYPTTTPYAIKSLHPNGLTMESLPIATNTSFAIMFWACQRQVYAESFFLSDYEDRRKYLEEAPEEDPEEVLYDDVDFPDDPEEDPGEGPGEYEKRKRIGTRGSTYNIEYIGNSIYFGLTYVVFDVWFGVLCALFAITNQM